MEESRVKYNATGVVIVESQLGVGRMRAWRHAKMESIEGQFDEKLHLTFVKSIRAREYTRSGVKRRLLQTWHNTLRMEDMIAIKVAKFGGTAPKFNA